MNNITEMRHTTAGPSEYILSVNVPHSLKSAPATITTNSKVEMLLAKEKIAEESILYLVFINSPSATGTTVTKNMVSPSVKILISGA